MLKPLTTETISKHINGGMKGKNFYSINIEKGSKKFFLQYNKKMKLDLVIT